MYNFNNLTPAEAERVALLIEEAGDVVQMAAKVLRHGFESIDPREGVNAPTNRQRLQEELGDLRAVIKLMIHANDVSEGDLIRATQAKNKRIAPWLHHQGPLPD